jgi:hypothetical protein
MSLFAVKNGRRKAPAIKEQTTGNLGERISRFLLGVGIQGEDASTADTDYRGQIICQSFVELYDRHFCNNV